MYVERGYRGRDVAMLVLKNSITGIEIDPRVATLAAFALAMKACELDRDFLRRAIAPRVTCLKSIPFSEDERQALGVTTSRADLFKQLNNLGEITSRF